MKTQPNAPFTEKWAPRELRDIVGQPHTVRSLIAFARAPVSKAFLFVGEPGVGKTSAAWCLAAAVGVSIRDREFGGLHQIASGEQTGETVRAKLWACRHTPWHGSGWNCLVINEADNMTESAAACWLDALEPANIPRRCLIVFTTNSGETLDRRFRQRCEVHLFQSAVDDRRKNRVERDADALIQRIWRAELHRNDAPTARDLPGVIVDGHLSYRQCLQALEPLIRVEKMKRCRRN
ncbi:MAG TPA: AAA family ATPase [Verrucomicrobiae bacterium]|nr:AAA family ATPase [Verrucomicrobiae bacterium]